MQAATLARNTRVACMHISHTHVGLADITEPAGPERHVGPAHLDEPVGLGPPVGAAHGTEHVGVKPRDLHFNPKAPPALPELEAQITELAGHLNAANHRLLALIAEFDRRLGWAASGNQSCAHWLSWKCGIDLGAAREKVRVALALEKLPFVSAAMAGGGLSYSKVRAITRVATSETEELLLTIALHGNTHHVETTVRCFRRAQQAEELSREARQQAARRLSYLYDEDGSLVLKGSLPAEVGALFIKAIEAALEAADRPGVSAETSAGAGRRQRAGVNSEGCSRPARGAGDTAPLRAFRLPSGDAARPRQNSAVSTSPCTRRKASRWASSNARKRMNVSGKMSLSPT